MAEGEGGRVNQREARQFRKLHANELYPELASARDIADHFDVAIGTVRSWVRRYADFPTPVAVVSGYTRVWNMNDVKTWWVKNKSEASPRFGEPAAEAVG